MINSNYVAKRYEDLNADTCMVNNQSVQSTVAAGQSANIDLKLTDDHFITGSILLANNANFGDVVTLQVMDRDLNLQGIYGAGITTMYPNYPVLRQFVTNWGVSADTQLKIDKTHSYPAKIMAGLYLRAIYTSTGTSNVNVILNYELHIVLV
jgi:hypothetical protein